MSIIVDTTKAFIFFFLVTSLSSSTAQKSILIKNPSNVVRLEEVISIDWSQIIAGFGDINPASMSVLDKTTRKEIPFQVVYEEGQKPMSLLIQTTLTALGSKQFIIKKQKPKTVIAFKTFGRYVPERLDDFAWENDKIAFRMYGKALEGTNGDAFGIDVWVKRTDKLVIDKRYKIAKYHEDLGDGLDYYHVGKTNGAGNCAPIVGDSIYYSGNYHRFDILENGPLRTKFSLHYDEWLVNGLKVTATKTITLDAGSQMNKIESTYQLSNDSLDLVVGIIKRTDAGVMNLDEKNNIMAYWEPQHGNDGTTGVGVILTSPLSKMIVNKEQIMALGKAKSGTPYIYYQGACWDKAKSITNADVWNKYLKEYQIKLQNPVIVSIK